LSYLLGLQRIGAKYVKYSGDQEEFSIYDLSVNVKNTPFRGNENNEFSADIFLTLKIPLAFGWGHLPDLVMKQKVKGRFVPKF